MSKLLVQPNTRADNTSLHFSPPASHVRPTLTSIPRSDLTPEPDASRFPIVAVSDAYAQATLTTRNEIMGKPLFEVFPDNPDDPNPTGVKNLTDALNTVLETRKPFTVATQKYDIPRPDKSF